MEAKNKRQDAQAAREFVVALPDELDGGQRRQLALDLARHIADTYQVAADVAIHAPGRDGDHRNHHARILTSTNTVNPDGTLGNKARALDLVAHNMGGGVGTANAIDTLRLVWAGLANQALERAGSAERIDHRSLEAQGIDRAPTRHLGPAVSGLVRRGETSDVARRMAEEANARLAAAQEIGRIERELAAADRSILDLSADLAKAKADRDRQTADDLAKRQAEARQAEDRRKAEQDEARRQEAEDRAWEAEAAAFIDRHWQKWLRVADPASKEAVENGEWPAQVEAWFRGEWERDKARLADPPEPEEQEEENQGDDDYSPSPF